MDWKKCFFAGDGTDGSSRMLLTSGVTALPVIVFGVVMMARFLGRNGILASDAWAGTQIGDKLPVVVLLVLWGLYGLFLMYAYLWVLVRYHVDPEGVRTRFMLERRTIPWDGVEEIRLESVSLLRSGAERFIVICGESGKLPRKMSYMSLFFARKHIVLIKPTEERLEEIKRYWHRPISGSGAPAER